MTTTLPSITLSEAALKLLKRASKMKSVSIFFAEGRQTASELINVKFFRPQGFGDYCITDLGKAFLGELPQTEDETSATVDQRKPKQKRQRLTATKHFLKETHEDVQPVRFNKLSPRQRAILRFIDRCAKEIGFPPTYREIGDECAISSSSVVQYNIDRLIKYGWLERVEGVSRSLVIARELPGSKTKNDIHVAHGVLRIVINLADEPEGIVAAAQAGIERLQTIITAAQSQGGA